VETPEGANIGLVLNLASYARITNMFYRNTLPQGYKRCYAKEAVGQIARNDLEDAAGKVIVKAGAVITDAAAKRLAGVKNKATWPVKSPGHRQNCLFGRRRGRTLCDLPAPATKLTPRATLKMPASALVLNLEAGEVDAD